MNHVSLVVHGHGSPAHCVNSHALLSCWSIDPSKSRQSSDILDLYAFHNVLFDAGPQSYKQNYFGSMMHKYSMQ
jgi:hypothetical protein